MFGAVRGRFVCCAGGFCRIPLCFARDLRESPLSGWGGDPIALHGALMGISLCFARDLRESPLWGWGSVFRALHGTLRDSRASHGDYGNRPFGAGRWRSPILCRPFRAWGNLDSSVRENSQSGGVVPEADARWLSGMLCASSCSPGTCSHHRSKQIRTRSPKFPLIFSS
jgi:hypothetical protein